MSNEDLGASGEADQIRRRERRAKFRRTHHYFPYLKYWETYEHKFDYLDNKSQGLLSISGILSAVFLLQFSVISAVEWRDLSGFLAAASFALSATGLFCVLRAQFVLLRCLSTTADSGFPTHSIEAREIEERVNAQSTGQTVERTRVLESNLDKFLSQHRSMIQEIGEDHKEQEKVLIEIWERIRKNEVDDFREFEEDVSTFFGKLRDTIEGEVDARHAAYAAARLWVENSLYYLLSSVILFILMTLIVKL